VHDLNAGVGDENVDRPESLGGEIDAGVDLILIGNVRGDGERDLLAAELARGGLRRVEIEVGDRDARAGLDEALGDA